MPATTPSTCASSLREYVWPLTGIDAAKPIAAVTRDVELAHLAVVAVEEREERRLRAGGALHAAEGQRGDAMLEIGEVEHEVLHPQRGALADGGELRRLQVRVAEAGQRPPRAREGRQRTQRIDALVAQQLEAARMSTSSRCR
jgi:hypothetical protein